MKKILSILIFLVFLTACTSVNESVPAGGEAEHLTEMTDTSFEASETKEDITSESSAEAVSEDRAEDITEAESDIASEVMSEAETSENSSEDVTEIQLTFYSASLYVGDNTMPIVTMLPESAPDKSEIWTSSDENVAVVNDMGRITAISEGSCVITVQSAANPEISAEVQVTVKAAPDSPTYINGILIANKSYPLPSSYNPGVDPDAQAAFDRMQSAAAAEGLNIYISSGFRSYEYQKGLYDRYVQRSGKAEADRYSARPGHSEHQTGLAFDLNSIDMDFADTDEYVWVKEHCAEYGFIIRYPEDGEAITGYMYEPWHLRYLGVDTAKAVAESGLTLEEYLGIDSKYDE